MALRTTDDPFPADAVTVHEAAALVRVSAKTISRRIWTGRLRCWRDRVSGRLRLSRADVLDLWEARAPANWSKRRTTSTRKREAEKAAARTKVREMLGLPTEG